MFKYDVSKHAIQRYQERCGGRGKGEVLRHNALKWANTYIPQAEFLGVFADGHVHYRYKQYEIMYRDWETDRKSTRLNSSHRSLSRMPSSA